MNSCTGRPLHCIEVMSPEHDKAGSQSVTIQEAQLSQRDRATLRVIEYFAQSLKITQGHSKNATLE